MMSANHELLIQIQYILLYGAWAIVGFYGILRFLRFFCEEDNKYFSKLVYSSLCSTCTKHFFTLKSNHL